MTLARARKLWRSYRSSSQSQSCLFRRSHIRQFDCFPVYSVPPAWKRLISRSFSVHDRISLITSIFLDRNEVKVVERLTGDDAQSFIDVISEVSLHSFTSEEHADRPHSNSCALLDRCWIIFHHRPTENVCAIYTRSVVAKRWFRDHWRFRSATTQMRTRCAMVGLQTYGRVSIVARTSQPRF